MELVFELSSAMTVIRIIEGCGLRGVASIIIVATAGAKQNADDCRVHKIKI